MKATFCVAVVAAVMAVAVVSATGNFGSYIVSCSDDNTKVTFTNWATQNCMGSNSTNSTSDLTTCGKELLFFSWNSKCNATNMWYNNFLDKDCSGKSVLTRTYTRGSCFNCPNKECKNP